ncbi:MAG: hypothetical protein WBQ78_15395 [Gammaproteobacteria bacterium]
MDPVLVVLVVLLSATLLAFLAGIIPYPVGLLLLLVLITARILYRRGAGNGGR